MPLKVVQTPGEEAAHSKAMRRMVNAYSLNMPCLLESSKTNASSSITRGGEVVLLTGTTGALGSELLVDLVASEHVSRVYTYNRPMPSKTIRQRHQETFADRGLDMEVLLSKKVVFLEGDTSQAHLGLGEEIYEELRISLTLIIHNAWRKGFKHSLDVFEPNIQGARKLLDFAFSCTHARRLRFLFISSFTVGQSWPHTSGAFPEESFEDPYWSVGHGYGESKYVTERLLVKAAENGLQTCSLRVGQICGGRANGAWSMDEWVPLLIKSSVALGCLPEQHGLASFISFDATSHVILDVAFSPSALPTILGVVHPRAVSWKAAFETVSQALQEAAITAEPLPLVRMTDWVEKLETRAKGAKSIERRAIPLWKLLPMARIMMNQNEENWAEAGRLDEYAESGRVPDWDASGYTTAHAKAFQMSQTLRSEPLLGIDDAKRWVRYWKERGFFAETAKL